MQRLGNEISLDKLERMRNTTRERLTQAYQLSIDATSSRTTESYSV
jgi:hypothetical protein